MGNLSEKFKDLRLEKRLTQQGLADILEVKKQNISNIEGNLQNPSFELLKKLIERLNINANWLIADRGTMYIEDSNEALKAELHRDLEKLLADRGL